MDSTNRKGRAVLSKESTRILNTYSAVKTAASGVRQRRLTWETEASEISIGYFGVDLDELSGLSKTLQLLGEGVGPNSYIFPLNFVF